MKFVYQELPAQDASVNRCEVLQENHLQCPQRANYELKNPTEANAGGPLKFCAFHYTLERELGAQMGDEYEIIPLHADTLNPAPYGIPSQEYRPPQK